MAFEDDVTLIEEYTRWQAEKKLKMADLSATEFMVERAMASAYGRVERALKYITTCDDFGDELDRVDLLAILEE